MRDPARISKVLAEIQRIWETCPDLRFGQLVLNAIAMSGRDPYYIEEDALVEALRELYDK